VDLWLDEARRLRRDGLSDDETARALIEAGASPTEAIKAVRAECEVSLGDAKALVHRNLSAEQQRTAERLWDEAEASLGDES
jgi:ribosomal protein L7/L12